MEVELFSNVISEDTVELNFDIDIDNFDLEGERCGICMDIIIDRGVLDGCQHWFCFECIDSWSTIANLCPLCQSEFQIITCVPVYDTIGDNKTDEDLDLRDDDWCAEGKNNALSFPSYYIDENAVACLDGDGCKIRNESVTCEETLLFDISVACDSCHIWYHAFCVGFDPEKAVVDSWLCPRCLISEAQKKSDFREACRTINLLKSESAHCRCSASTFPGIKASHTQPSFPLSKLHESSVESESNEKDIKIKCHRGCDEYLPDASGKGSCMKETCVKADMSPTIGKKRKHDKYRDLNCSRNRGKWS